MSLLTSVAKPVLPDPDNAERTDDHPCVPHPLPVVEGAEEKQGDSADNAYQREQQREDEADDGFQNLSDDLHDARMMPSFFLAVEGPGRDRANISRTRKRPAHAATGV